MVYTGNMLKVVYAFFVGLLLAIFVGVGISTFYTAPQPPREPIYGRPAAQTDAEIDKAQQEAVAAQEEYSKQVSTYNRNVSIIALVAAVVFVAAGLMLASRINILSDGLLLGGVFTLIYSLGRGFMTDENTYRFMIVTAGLVVALVLGYIKFIKPEQKTTAKARR